MIDRQTQAVAMALDPIAWQSGELWDFSEHIERRNRSLKQAGTAIAASDAKYVPMLVGALNAISSTKYPTSVFTPLTEDDWAALHDFCKSRGYSLDRISGEFGRMFTATTSDIARKALSQLPEDLR